MPAPSPPAGSVPHKMTAKASEGEAAERKRRVKLLLPLLWRCLLSCAAQQQQKCLTDASSISYASDDASSPLPGVREISTSVPPSSKLRDQISSLLATIRSVRLIVISFAFCYCASPQKIWDYGTHGVRAEVEAATPLWMAAKFCWFRAGKSQACKSVG